MVKLFQVQLEHYEKIEGETLSLEGKANQLGQMVRSNLPAAMQGFAVVPLFAGYDHRRDRGRVFSYDVTGGKYEEADFQTNGSGGVHARNWIKATWTRGHGARRRHRPRAAVAVRGGRRGHRHRRPRPHPAHLPDRGGDLLRRLRQRSPTTRSPPAPSRSTADAKRGAGCEHAVLRPAGTDDEGPRRLRAEGHRTRAQPGRVQRRRRHRARRREPVPHALQDLRDLRPHRVRAASASTTSSRCCASPACARPTSRATRSPAKTSNARALANAYGQTLGPGLHPRDEALRGRDPRRAGRASRSRTTSCTTSSTTAPSWTKRAAPCSAGRRRTIADALESRFNTELDAAAAIRLGAEVLAGPETVAHRRPARGRVPRPHPVAPGVPSHQGRRARRHPRRRRLTTSRSASPSTSGGRRRARCRAARSRAARRAIHRSAIQRCAGATARSVPASHQSLGAVSVASTSSASST